MTKTTVSMSALKGKTIGFIGAGKMGQAILQGLIQQGFPKQSLYAADAMASTRGQVKRTLGITATADNARVVQKAQILVLAVKPQQLSEVLKALAPSLTKKHLIISIAAGVTLSNLQKALGGVAFIRVMPNLPATVGLGFSALAGGRLATATHMRIANQIFSAVGKTATLDEKHFDAITAVSGSGPAYVFYLIQAWQEAAVKLKLPESVATDAVLATLFGSAQLFADSGDAAKVLIQKVASKKGTTEAALKVLNKQKVNASIQQAVKAAAIRSKELRCL